MNSKQDLLNLFLKYEFNNIYTIVKDIEYDKNKSIEIQYPLAFKVMLLASWFGDIPKSKSLLTHFPLILKDPIIHFCITYAYLCVNDTKKYKYHMKHFPKSSPVWMSNYLKIELHGRSKEFKLQSLLVKKLISKNNYLKNYIKIALLQSLEQAQIDISYLLKLFKNINIEDNEPLSIALSLKVGLIKTTDIDNNINSHPYLLYKVAEYQIDSLQLVEGLKTYDQLAEVNFLNLNSIHEWLVTSLSIPQGQDYLLNRINFILNSIPNNLFVNGTAATYALIYSYLTAQYQTAYNIAHKYIEYINLPQVNTVANARVFFEYISKLCNFWQENQVLYEDNRYTTQLIVFGESHSLSLSNINITLNNKLYKVNTNFIMGTKMYHLKPNKDTFYSKALQLHIKQLQANSNLLFTIGEIDTRPSEGIWKNHVEKGKDIDTLIGDTVSGYIESLAQNLKEKKLSTITIQGIPAPGYEFKDKLDPGENIDGFLDMFVKINNLLKELTLKQGWNFLDIYSATVGEDKRGNKEWHIDGIHLQPLIYTQADKWLIKPEPKEELKTTTIDFSKPLTISLSKPS